MAFRFSARPRTVAANALMAAGEADQHDGAGPVAIALALGLLTLASPFLVASQSLTGAIIIWSGIYEAWKTNRRIQVEVTGPLAPPALVPAQAPREAWLARGLSSSAAPSEYVEDATHSEFFVLAKPAFESSDLGRVESVLADLREAADQRLAAPAYAGLEVGFGGPMVFQRAFDQGVRGDLGRVSLWSLILASTFLFIALRRPLAVLVVILPIVVSIAMTLAFAALWVGHLTIISGILVAVLLRLGLEFGLDLVLRTAEARETRPMREALLVAGRETMEGALSGAITNAAAFAVLLGCTFRAFRRRGPGRRPEPTRPEPGALVLAGRPHP